MGEYDLGDESPEEYTYQVSIYYISVYLSICVSIYTGSRLSTYISLINMYFYEEPCPGRDPCHV